MSERARWIEALPVLAGIALVFVGGGLTCTAALTAWPDVFLDEATTPLGRPGIIAVKALGALTFAIAATTLTWRLAPRAIGRNGAWLFACTVAPSVVATALHGAIVDWVSVYFSASLAVGILLPTRWLAARSPEMAVHG